MKQRYNKWLQECMDFPHPHRVYRSARTPMCVCTQTNNKQQNKKKKQKRATYTQQQKGRSWRVYPEAKKKFPEEAHDDTIQQQPSGVFPSANNDNNNKAWYFYSSAWYLAPTNEVLQECTDINVCPHPNPIPVLKPKANTTPSRSRFFYELFPQEHNTPQPTYFSSKDVDTNNNTHQETTKAASLNRFVWLHVMRWQECVGGTCFSLLATGSEPRTTDERAHTVTRRRAPTPVHFWRGSYTPASLIVTSRATSHMVEARRHNDDCGSSFCGYFVISPHFLDKSSS